MRPRTGASNRLLQADRNKRSSSQGWGLFKIELTLLVRNSSTVTTLPGTLSVGLPLLGLSTTLRPLGTLANGWTGTAMQPSTSSGQGRASGAHWSCAGGNTEERLLPRGRRTQHWASKSCVIEHPRPKPSSLWHSSMYALGNA
ncbi:hypothetical protein HaLaN_16018 [Haematococcus lacustris]|uniref:Uncharacterized protein n=1 Tax=Haematococcus lacustris TaxID=44745 RepID=A0A699ZKR0_HAELA|nr:hypothetical protein HaLaN_16018 [Haematococcus lacustris]